MQLRAFALIGAVLAFYYLFLRGYRVRFKDGVVLATAPEMSRALPVIDRVSRETIGRGVIVTSGTDGKHSAGSKHYTGLAVDLRTNDLTAAEITRYATALDQELNRSGHQYDVIIEATHIHIEYDPASYRKGVIRL